ncbi:hypothetical protein L2E82_13600 [Cichorium intybus]|uniref:Uncharacterized protein n=1 Tax=Cichorium intybus TaxID=13427 RepID=A0ACB9EXR7_CICIN|nr:hypothetical protein L2E82_13600 [Cichorium intybus]
MFLYIANLHLSWLVNSSWNHENSFHFYRVLLGRFYVVIIFYSRDKKKALGFPTSISLAGNCSSASHSLPSSHIFLHSQPVG